VPVPRIVTTSFDDGHPLDVKVAEKLAERGLKGTFYVACNHPKGPEIATADLRRLRALGMEVGSHTYTHRMLTARPRHEVVDELVQSKRAIEDLIGEPVTSLSYPEGLFTRTIRSTVAECGYRLARTTIAFRTKVPSDPTVMPITIEGIPLSRFGHARHAARDRNVSGLWKWWRVTRCETDLVRAAQLFFDSVLQKGGVFHFYARSWQIDQLGMWDAFDRILAHVSRWEEVRYVTNGEVAGTDERGESR
jgi:peptidoglycan/xylan/chitin deacetylase (PgdA/CDA1 family)